MLILQESRCATIVRSIGDAYAVRGDYFTTSGTRIPPSSASGMG